MIHITQEQLYHLINLYFWPLTRILAFMAVEPLLSVRAVPRRVRLGLGLALTVVVAPLLESTPTVLPSGPVAMLLLAQQILIGVSMGFVARLVFTAIEMAGSLAGLQMGLSFAAQVDPVHGSQTPVVAQWMSLFATLLFLALNGHLLMLSVLVESFHLLPVSTQPLQLAGMKDIALFGARIFSIGLWLSLPVVASLLLTNLVIGVVARASPQMNLFAVGFPITLVIGLAALYFSLPSMQGVLSRVFDMQVHMMLDLLRALRPV